MTTKYLITLSVCPNCLHGSGVISVVSGGIQRGVKVSAKCDACGVAFRLRKKQVPAKKASAHYSQGRV